MKYLTGKQKMTVIETLISEDLVMDDKERLSRIYRVAHSNKSCRHPDWEIEAIKSYEGFKKAGLI